MATATPIPTRMLAGFNLNMPSPNAMTNLLYYLQKAAQPYAEFRSEATPDAGGTSSRRTRWFGEILWPRRFRPTPRNIIILN
jgi:hypothetical protein